MSNMASAVRFVELSSAPCAVVYSEHGHVVWAKRSRTFPGRIPAQLKIGDGSIAHDFHQRKPLDASVREVPSGAWFGSTVPSHAGRALVEHVEMVPEPGWGGLLSLLVVPNVETREHDLEIGEARVG